MQLSLTLLLRYRSRDVFRVGGSCPPNSRAISEARYSGSPESPSRLAPTGLSPSSVPRSSGLRVERVGSAGVLSHHIPPPLLAGVRFALCPLRSPLLRASRLISSPAPTRMLYFGAFPIPTDRHETGSPIRRSPVRRFLAPTRGISQLGTTFVGARAEPSPRQRS